MFLAFDFEVWIAIVITKFIGVVVIEIIKRCPIEVRHFVFGHLITTPILNLISIYLTGGQKRSPGRNFSRFLLMLFVIRCMIIRTCYQSKLFEFLQSNSRKLGPETFEELVEQNFTFYTENDIDDLNRTVNYWPIERTINSFVQEKGTKMQVNLKS
jgi:hypothetical protein